MPETYVEAKFARAERRLTLRQVWRGIEGGTSFTAGDDFGRAIQYLYIPFPETWDAAMGVRLEAAYGLKYFAQGAHELGFTGIPDGGFKTLCVPVPVGRLADLYRCVEEMRDDPQLMTPVSVRLELRSRWIGSNAKSSGGLLRKAATFGNGRWSNFAARCTQDCTRQIAGP